MNRAREPLAEEREPVQYDFRSRKSCEICGASEPCELFAERFDRTSVSNFLERYYGGRLNPASLSLGRYQILSCSECGFVWQGYVLKDKGLSRLYDHWIDAAESEQKSRRQGAVTRASMAHQMSLASALLAKPPAETVAMDFGMGWGNWCAMARGFGFDVFGAELAETRIAHAEASGLRVLSQEDWPKAIDLINTEQVFEHIADPVPVLRMLVDHLAPGGLLRVSVPDGRKFLRTHARGDWQPGKDAVHPLEHVNAFTHESLLAFGACCGLRPVPALRFAGAQIRAFWAGAVSVRGVAEALRGHTLGVAVWFRKA